MAALATVKHSDRTEVLTLTGVLMAGGNRSHHHQTLRLQRIETTSIGGSEPIGKTRKTVWRIFSIP